MRGAVVLFITGALGLSAVQAAAPQSWEFRDGRWPMVSTADSATTQPATDPVLDRAEQLLSKRNHGAAKRLLVPWVKANKQHPLRDRALYLLAETYYQYGDRIRAYYYLDELMDTYPASPLYYSALERQYQIADAYLNGYKRRFLLVPMLGAEEEAVEMLYRLQQRSPGSPLAERALLRTADYYYANSDFDFAADAYGAYARSYPRSPHLPRVRLRQAFSSLAQYRGLRFEATPLIDARVQLQNIAAQYPDLAEEENVEQMLERIDRALAQKIFLTADFYRRTHEPVAAVYNYRYLIERYPTTPEASEARDRLARMPVWALRSEPPIVEQDLPIGSSGNNTTPAGVAAPREVPGLNSNRPNP